MRRSIKAIAALAVTTAALAGAGQASAATSFGADVNPDVQPSNASSPHECNGYQPPLSPATRSRPSAQPTAAGC